MHRKTGWNALGLVGLVFAPIGLIFVLISLAMSQAGSMFGDTLEAGTMLVSIFGGVGGLFLILGLAFLAHELLRRHRLRRAFDDGIRVDAKILGLVPETRVTVNHVHPWVLECAYTDTSGVVHIYRSRYLYTDVSEFLTSDTVPVYIDRVNEKTAFVDVDAVLPEIRKHY